MGKLIAILIQYSDWSRVTIVEWSYCFSHGHIIMLGVGFHFIGILLSLFDKAVQWAINVQSVVSERVNQIPLCTQNNKGWLLIAFKGYCTWLVHCSLPYLIFSAVNACISGLILIGSHLLIWWWIEIGLALPSDFFVIRIWIARCCMLSDSLSSHKPPKHPWDVCVFLSLDSISVTISAHCCVLLKLSPGLAKKQQSIDQKNRPNTREVTLYMKNSIVSNAKTCTLGNNLSKNELPNKWAQTLQVRTHPSSYIYKKRGILLRTVRCTFWIARTTGS